MREPPPVWEMDLVAGAKTKLVAFRNHLPRWGNGTSLALTPTRASSVRPMTVRLLLNVVSGGDR